MESIAFWWHREVLRIPVCGGAVGGIASPWYREAQRWSVSVVSVIGTAPWWHRAVQKGRVSGGDNWRHCSLVAQEGTKGIL